MVETFLGMLFVALMTGLFFSKFSRASDKFIFSDKLLVTNHEGQRTLMCRVANARSNQVMDAQVSLHVLYDETNVEGVKYRRFTSLPLARPHTPIFALSLTCVHFLKEGSQSESLVERALRGENIEFLISISGLDETFGQTIHFNKLYKRSDLHLGGQFLDILHLAEDGSRVIDFGKFNELR